MSSNFDELLKRAKQSIAGSNTEEDRWKELIVGVMQLMHQLNSIYKNDKKHNVKIEAASCQICNEATFILVAKQLNNNKASPMRFHKSKWRYADGKYYCEKCKKD